MARNRSGSDVLAVLSEREREIFRMAAECLMTREIAAELCISRKTVDTHLYRIHRKLGLRTSAPDIADCAAAREHVELLVAEAVCCVNLTDTSDGAMTMVTESDSPVRNGRAIAPWAWR